jgi:two-component system NtrC family sensor kinase
VNAAGKLIEPGREGYDRRVSAFWALAQRIAQAGTRGSGRLAFLREVSAELLAFSGAGRIDWWMSDGEHEYSWCMDAGDSDAASYATLRADGAVCVPPSADPRLSDRIVRFLGHLGDGAGGQSPRLLGPLSGQASRDRLWAAAESDATFARLKDLPPDASCLLMTLREDAGISGLVALTDMAGNRLSAGDAALYEQLADTLGRAVSARRAQFRLRERIKELTCLHGVAQVVQQHGGSLEAALGAIVSIVPPAMQFPELAAAKLTVDDRAYATCESGETDYRLCSPVVAAGRRRGELAVWYSRHHAEFAAGVFLREERDLLASVAHEVAMLIERNEAAAARETLAEQLRHADRLATIGQLAAGVAHELNEPLGNVMGFAQLLEKGGGLSEAGRRDAQQIVKAALLFSRQSDARRVRLDLGELVRQSLYFLEARCRQGGIDLRLELTSEPTSIEGVASELTQVVVNLAVNAMQAMPTGGVLTVRTQAAAAPGAAADSSGTIELAVEDTGTGMDEATQQRLFTPFFTTKDVGEGTGLGLSVVLGIVSAHGGTIHVDSAPGRGSRFVIRLPVAASPGGPNASSP